MKNGKMESLEIAQWGPSVYEDYEKSNALYVLV